ncbi:hypothetical protein, partial [Enterobacter mori]
PGPRPHGHGPVNTRTLGVWGWGWGSIFFNYIINITQNKTTKLKTHGVYQLTLFYKNHNHRHTLGPGT